MKKLILKSFIMTMFFAMVLSSNTLLAKVTDSTQQFKNATTVVTKLNNGETIKAKYQNKKLIWFEIYDVNGKPKPKTAFKR